MISGFDVCKKTSKLKNKNKITVTVFSRRQRRYYRPVVGPNPQ